MPPIQQADRKLTINLRRTKMKRSLLILALFVCALSFLYAQTPQKITYQAVIRNSAGQLILNQNVGIRISIIKDTPSGTDVYSEVQVASTNSNGLLSIEFGGNTGFDAIDWSSGIYFLKTEIDPDGGTNYSITGISQILSVPYAFHSKTAESITGTLNETDPLFMTSAAAGISQTNIDTWNNKQNLLTAGTGIEITNNIINVTGGVNPGSALPTVSTSGVDNTDYKAASISGDVTDAGNELIVARGFCYATHSSPTFADSFIQTGNGPGTFSGLIEGLLPNTTYNVRAFATNIVGTSYGNELTFSTPALKVPALETTVVSNISTTTAQSGGNITDDGGSDILARGVCWSTTSSPDINGNHSSDGTGADGFTSLLTGLTPNALYYVRAYATNSQGTGYGNELSFTTNTLSLASVTTTAIGNISYTTATGGGNVTADNGSSVTGRGICWSTSPAPTTSDGNYTEAGGLGSFTATMTGLLPATTYYVRAFAVNQAGTVYGNEYNFPTLALSAPVLTTKDVSGISSNIAGSGGNITAYGGSPITAKGVCWSINPSPDLSASFTNDGTGPESYNSTMDGLTPLTKYYVRAYATNGSGTAYGNEVSFTTTDLVNPGPSVPVIGTSSSSITGGSTASSGGYVSNDGGSSVVARGVCWSLVQSPTLSDNYTVDGSGLGFFTSQVTGLSGCGTVYYIRAYATNSTGTGYGNEVTVTTGLLPSVTTNDPSGIGYNAAVSGGSITDDGGCPILQKGVCWSYNTNPTISNSKTQEGPGSDPFVSNLTGLYSNRTYYVRAYATNNKGTQYGPEKVFTTLTPATPYIGQNYAGGIVFYVDGTGQHGLVMAAQNQGGHAWGCSGTSIPTGSIVGTGASNTAAIVVSCSESNIAAKICDNLTLNEYSDWYLPSRDELNLIYVNLYLQNLGNLSSDFYWSSTEYNASEAYYHFFYNNDRGYISKGQGFLVLPIRSF
jgi:hypothetical protein